MAKVTYRSSSGAAARVLGPIVDRAAYRAAQKLRSRAIQNIRASGRVDTGNMIRQMQVRRVMSTGTTVAYEVRSTAPYSVYQEEGTRAHGPRRSRFMVFTPKGSQRVVFARWVRGVTPAHFMRNAMRSARVEDWEPTPGDIAA